VTTTTATGLAPYTVLLLNAAGDALTVEADFDASAFNVVRTSETRAFVASHLGATAYRVNDDCEIVSETVADVRVTLDGLDVTADFR
jgi:hypothetical protein